MRPQEYYRQVGVGVNEADWRQHLKSFIVDLRQLLFAKVASSPRVTNCIASFRLRLRQLEPNLLIGHDAHIPQQPGGLGLLHQQVLQRVGHLDF